MQSNLSSSCRWSFGCATDSIRLREFSRKPASQRTGPFWILAVAREALQLIHGLLKPSGGISIKDHRLNNEQIINMLTKQGWFRLIVRRKKTLQFDRVEQAGGGA